MLPAFVSPAEIVRNLRSGDGWSVELLEHPLDYCAATSNVTIPLNVTGHPVAVTSIQLPPNSLPIGMQIVGQRRSDLTLLETAMCLGEVAGAWNPPLDTQDDTPQ